MKSEDFMYRTKRKGSSESSDYRYKQALFTLSYTVSLFMIFKGEGLAVWFGVLLLASSMLVWLFNRERKN